MAGYISLVILLVFLPIAHGLEKNRKLEINLFKPDFKSDPEPFVLSKDVANNFIRSPGRRVRRDLWEECYDEGCSFEEVEEVVGGHAMYQYYYGWRCMRLYGWTYTYSYNPHRLQCVNSLVGLKTCARGTSWLSNGQSRACNLGGAKTVLAVYIENGCNNGQLGSYQLIFDDPNKSVRTVYNMGCREKKYFDKVVGATSFVAKLVGGGRLANQHIGWFGYNSHYCGHPGNPTNGYIIGKNFYQPSTVTYRCQHNYIRVGTERRYCWSFGWTGAAPSCKRICDAGTFSSTGYEPCSPCAIGTYQPNQQKTSCLACPTGTSTSQTGRRFLSECHPKCSQAICTLMDWSNWADSSTPFQSSCASQKRTRTYQISWKQVVNSGGCDSVSKTCPADSVEHKTKEVYCDPLTKPQFGYYEPAGCTTTKQACRTTSSSTCIFYCNNGFERVGSTSDVRRVCQPNGQWSYSHARCKDITAPTITCPANKVVGNDDGKPFARITLDKPVVSDNSGKEPSYFITTPNIEPVQEFRISASPTKVEYKAVDAEGLSKTCSFEVQVTDQEKPAVTYCPKDYVIYTKNPKTNIMFKEPKFKDNFSPTPKIKTSHTPGNPFEWNTYQIVYNATDSAGNTASCSYKLQVSPMRCTLYDPPDNGVRSCNINLAGVAQEYICTVQCKTDYEFVTSPALYSAYNCKEDGNWYGHQGMTMFKLLTVKPGEKIWPDCSVKSTPTGVTKKATVYAGTCLSADEATQNQIKQNFINSLKGDIFLNIMMCGNGVDCQLNNVKVYCGKNSKRKRRGLSANVFVIHVDMDLLDLAPSTAESVERLKIKGYADVMEQNKQKVQDLIKKAAANAVNVQSDTVDVEDETVTGACAVGKVVVVKDGGGTGLERSECVDCSLGSYYDVVSKTCILCKKGTYQDEEGQQYCKTCPSSTDTISVGAKSFKDCRDFCKKGEYSVSGLATCIACPKGEYQPNIRCTACLKCPDGTSTVDIRTQTQEDCKKFCAAGYFAREGGLAACVPCPRGSYQPHAKGINCIKCPSGMTTANDGSTSLSDCKAGCGMDFEDGHNNWTRTGTAFNNQPTYGDNPRYRNRESSQHQGNWWIGGYENRPTPSMSAGQVQGDGHQGTMTSPLFVITGNELSFLVGGGCNINLVRVELLIESAVVYKETGRCSESMLRKFWNVSAYKGKMAQVRLVDHSSGSWGHINFDDLRGDTCI